MEAGTWAKNGYALCGPVFYQFVLRLDDRPGWRDTPHIATYVVTVLLYHDIRITF